MKNTDFPVSGRCTCGHVHYRLNCAPMFVHCCHCSWCQRETGSAFALNALIEADQLSVVEGSVEKVKTPSNSGSGQTIIRCTECRVALWSHYGAAIDRVAFVRVGTLERPDLYPPDIHIYTSSKQPWFELGSSVTQVPEYYRRSEFWPEESIRRYKLVTVR